MKKLAVFVALMLLPTVIFAGDVLKDGDPGFFVGFTPGPHNVIKGENWCDFIAPTNFSFVSGTCTTDDTFCMTYYELLGWVVTGVDDPDGACFEQPGATYHWSEVCIQVPCDAPLAATNTLTAIMSFCDVDGVCQPDSGDCEDPNWYSGNPYYSTTATSFIVVDSPPALYILQDTLYAIEKGATAAYVPFEICNGDPCAPATDYGWNIKSLGWVGAAIDMSGTAVGVVGGTCETVYGIIDAGLANTCDYDTLTIIAWDDATGTVYDTCVQIIHIVEPVPVPLFTAPVVTILVLAMILAAAVIMKRTAISRA